jgi:hypothetical protein
MGYDSDFLNNDNNKKYDYIRIDLGTFTIPMNNGTIIANNEIYVGGISGHFGNSVTMIGCINEGKVSGTGTPANIGTIAGLINNATICTCNKNLNTEGNSGILDFIDGGNVANEIVSGCTNQH